MKITFFTRQISQERPLVPLPFYAHSTGVSVNKRGEAKFKGSLLNQFVEIRWILSGLCETIVANKKVVLGPNHVFYNLSGEERFLTCLSEECTSRWLCFDGPLADAVMFAYQYPRHQIVEVYPEELFNELESIMSDSSPLQIRRKSAIILEILAYMAGEDNTVHSTEKLIRQILTLIRGNLGNPDLSIDFLCDAIGISRATLTRIFQAHTNLSPGRYILNLKHQKAIGLLEGSDLPIEEISRECGFHDPRTFSRFIKRTTGLGPMAYRKEVHTPLPDSPSGETASRGRGNRIPREAGNEPEAQRRFSR